MKNICFDTIQNGVKSNTTTDCNRSLSSNVLLIEKSKPYEINRRILEVYGEACFPQKMSTNGFSMTALPC